MQICIAGWYFTPELYACLDGCEWPVFIVANRPSRLLQHYPQHHIRENRGLDFGAYDWFLKNKWDGVSPVFFMHDDVLISNPELFDHVKELGKRFDHFYAFRDVPELRENKGVHGRAFYCSHRFLRKLKEDHGGFWWDADNAGNTTDPFPENGWHYNEAICRFRDLAKSYAGEGMMTGTALVVSGINPARRGVWPDQQPASSRKEHAQ